MFQTPNNAQGNLLAGINSVVTSFTLESGDGNNFYDTSDSNSEPTTNVPLYLSIVQFNTNSKDDLEASRATGILKQEIVKCTNITTDTFTLSERGVGPSTAQSFDAGAFVFAFQIGEHWQNHNRFMLMDMSPLRARILQVF